MSGRCYSRDGSAYAYSVGRNGDKTLWKVYYEGHGWPYYEYHEIKLYDWAQRPHGNAPRGTPYGYFRATKTGKRIIVRV